MTTENKPSKLSAVVQRMVDIRSRIDEAKHEYDNKVAALKEMYEKGEAYIRTHLQESGEDGFKIAGVATVFTTARLKASVGDREAFKSFVLDTEDGIDLMEFRVSTTNLKTFMEANGGAVPPGVTARTERTLNIRRDNKAK